MFYLLKKKTKRVIAEGSCVAVIEGATCLLPAPASGQLLTLTHHLSRFTQQVLPSTPGGLSCLCLPAAHGVPLAWDPCKVLPASCSCWDSLCQGTAGCLTVHSRTRGWALVPPWLLRGECGPPPSCHTRLASR